MSNDLAYVEKLLQKLRESSLSTVWEIVKNDT